jgi:hypothetical protein
MVTNQEVRDYYAENRKDSNVGMCPEVVKEVLDTMVEDEKGLYTLSSAFLGGDREYYTLDTVKERIRAGIAQYIKDLQRIAEI